jgi:hypothetical protein
MRFSRSACAILASALVGACKSAASDADGSESAATNSKSTWSLVCNFDAATPGSLPSGFSISSGEWSVVEDPTAPSPTHAIAQTGKAAESAFNLVLMDDVKQADVDLAVRLKPSAGDIDQGGGLAWRVHDARNYYVARYNPLEHNFRVYKVIDGERKQLQSASVQLSAGWHDMRVTMHGETIRAYIDGNPYLSAHDASFVGAGKVGLWTKSDAQTHFDDLRVGELH